MPDERVLAGATAAGLFGIYADLAYNTYSATNSSPQTTELFSGEREQTLWKYVLIGHAQALAIGVFGTILSRKAWPLIGTVTVGAVMHAMYRHAMNAGKAQRPPTNAQEPTATRGGRYGG
jgi:hypothetical protein